MLGALGDKEKSMSTKPLEQVARLCPCDLIRSSCQLGSHSHFKKVETEEAHVESLARGCRVELRCV